MQLLNTESMPIKIHMCMVKPEKSFKRDHGFSLWHRELKDNWFMTDADHVLWSICNEECRTVALLEEKKSTISKIDLNDYQFQVLRDLADHRPLFVLLTHQNEEQKYLSFYVVAANKAAQKIMETAKQKDRRYLSESDYVLFESWLRKEPPPLQKVDKACVLLDKFPLPEIKEFQ